MQRKNSLLAVVAIAAVAMSACGTSASQAPSTEAPATSASSQSSGPSQAGFQLELPTGTATGTVDTSKYAKPGPYRICFSNGFSGNSWRAMMLESLKNYAAQHQDLIKDLIIVDGQGDVNKQVSDIESCIAQKVDAIMLIANSGTAVAPAVAKAVAAGIPVVPFNLGVDGNDWTTYLGTDACQKGTLMAKWLVEKLGANGGGIISLGGIPGNSYTSTAWGCAQKQFEGTAVKVLAYKDANWQEDNAKVVCTDLLTAYSQIDGIWADGGQDTTGCLKAFVAAGRAPVPSTGDDYNGLFKLYLANKDQSPNFDIYTLSEPTYESKLALQLVFAILTGAPDVPHQYLFTGEPITGENAAQAVKPNLPDAVFVDNDLTDEQLQVIFK